MTVALLLIGDGRDDYRAQTLESARQAGLLEQVSSIVEVDDREHRLGFAGAIQHGWDRILQSDAEWVFHLEADFTFNEPVDLAAMLGALRPRRGWLSQIVLKRQPWNEQESAAGGIVEQYPDDFDEWTGADGDRAPITLHDRFFSTNPCIYHRRIAEYGWPQEDQSEGKFTAMLREQGYRFAFWGGKFDPPRVHHIGAVRAGTGY